MSISMTNRSATIAVSFAIVAAIFMLTPDTAHAQSSGGLFGTGTNFLNALVEVLTATWARLIGIIAVVITGILWMTGRLNMGFAISVMGGLILVFGAAAIVDSVASAV